jgi:MoxR-like ATPase
MINKLSNIAFGFNDPTSAKKAIEKLLADEIAEARKKALVQAALTPEALLEKQQKRQASAAAAKATKERKKAAAAAAPAAAAAASTNANTNVALIADAIAAVPSTVVPSTAPCTDDTFLLLQ